MLFLVFCLIVYLVIFPSSDEHARMDVKSSQVYHFSCYYVSGRCVFRTDLLTWNSRSNTLPAQS